MRIILVDWYENTIPFCESLSLLLFSNQWDSPRALQSSLPRQRDTISGLSVHLLGSNVPFWRERTDCPGK